MDKKDIIKYVFGEAAKSNIEKRQVGCIIIDANDKIVGQGYNVEGKHAEIMALDNLATYVKAYAKGYDGPLTAYVSHQPCPDCAKQLLEVVNSVEVVEQFMKFDGDKVRVDLVPIEIHEVLAANALHDDLTEFNRKQSYNLMYTELVTYVGTDNVEALGRAIFYASNVPEQLSTSVGKPGDSGLPYTMIPTKAILGIAEVLTFGARKYKPNNWRKCEDCSRYLAAMWRHIFAFVNGEDTDPETGLHHMYHAMTNMVFMYSLNYKPNEAVADE